MTLQDHHALTSLSHMKTPWKMRHQDEAKDYKDTKHVCVKKGTGVWLLQLLLPQPMPWNQMTATQMYFCQIPDSLNQEQNEMCALTTNYGMIP